MAQKRQANQSLIKRLRARLKKQSSQLKLKSKKSMAYGRNWKRPRFSNPFKRRSYGGGSSRSFRPKRRSYGGGGFSRRMPIVGIRIPNLLIWLAIIGGGIFFGKDYIKPLIDKMKNKI